MTGNDEYHRRRADQHRKLSAATSNECSQAAHRRLAELHEAACEPAVQLRPKLMTVTVV